MLTAEKVTKFFGSKQVLTQIDLSLKKGKVTAILGPNGAGKTTLINILSTLLKPTSGKITAEGIDIIKNPFTIRPKIGLLAHEPLLYLELTPLENLKLFSKLYGTSLSEENLKHKLDQVGLLPYLHEDIRFFSHGMLRKLAIAKAVIGHPELVLLDEPFAGLDASAQAFTIELIDHFKQANKSVLLATHIIELAYTTSDEFVLLFGGKITDTILKKDCSLEELLLLYKRRFD